MHHQRSRRTAAVAIITVFAVSACQSQGDTNTEEGKKNSQSCEGSLTSAAQKAAKSLVESGSLRTYAPDGGPSGTAKTITAEFRSSGSRANRDHDLCLIYKGDSDLSSVDVSFSLVNEVPAKGKAASTFTEYKLGALALAGTRSASLYLECSSNDFSDGKETTVILRGEVRSRYEPEGDAQELRKDNLTVVHSAGLSLAKALACTDDAALPSSFAMPSEL